MIQFAQKFFRVGVLALPALAFTQALPAEPSNAELLAEIQALRARLVELENRILEEPAKERAAPAVAPQSAPKSEGVAVNPPAKLPEKSSSITYDFYGYVKVDASYQTQNTNLAEIPFWVLPEMTSPSNADGQTNFTAKESRLGVNITGPAYAGGVVKAKFEADFYGNFALNNHHAYQPRTRHIYTEWSNGKWSVLAGKTWETYLSVFPQTVNFTAYNLQGQLGLRRAQIRVTRALEIGDDQMLTLKLALSEPLGQLHGGDLDVDGIDDGAESGLPNFEYNLEYKRPGLRLALSGFAGRESLDTTPTVMGGDYDSWALILGGEWELHRVLSLRGSIWTGSNLDSAWGGVNQGINVIQGRSIDGSGGWVQLGWKAMPDLSLNIGYGIDDPEDSMLETGQRTYNESITLNGLYKLNNNLTLGLEFMHLRTGYRRQTTESAQRVQGAVKYAF